MVTNEGLTEEWAVAHAQGTYTGSGYGSVLNEQQARAWAASNIAQDARRRHEARGMTRLLRRQVTAWEEVALDGDA